MIKKIINNYKRFNKTLTLLMRVNISILRYLLHYIDNLKNGKRHIM